MATFSVPLEQLPVLWNYPRKFQATVHSLQTPTLTYKFRTRFSNNFLLGIDWFSTKQLYLHQGPWSFVVLDPTPFPLHMNHGIHTSTMHDLLVKTILTNNSTLQNISYSSFYLHKYTQTRLLSIT